jgi:prepilin-type N-terminal cleavage/methylation domain-containing protein
MAAMSLPSHPSRLLGRQRFPRPAVRAFSLVELMIAVLIISMIFVMAVPTYQRIQRKARATSVANDFRVFGAAFQAYAHEKGAWPAESTAGVIPTGITSQDIQTVPWSKMTPIGGKFDWEYNQVHPGGTSPGGKWHAALAVTGTTDAPLIVDADIMQEIDESLDDGDLDTGNFRKGFGDCPILIIEP